MIDGLIFLISIWRGNFILARLNKNNYKVHVPVPSWFSIINLSRCIFINILCLYSKVIKNKKKASYVSYITIAATAYWIKKFLRMHSRLKTTLFVSLILIDGLLWSQSIHLVRTSVGGYIVWWFYKFYMFLLYQFPNHT